jgi:hypothetical protein
VWPVDNFEEVLDEEDGAIRGNVATELVEDRFEQVFGEVEDILAQMAREKHVGRETSFRRQCQWLTLRGEWINFRFESFVVHHGHGYS